MYVNQLRWVINFRNMISSSDLRFGLKISSAAALYLYSLTHAQKPNPTWVKPLKAKEFSNVAVLRHESCLLWPCLRAHG